MKLEIKLKDPKYCNGCPCWKFPMYEPLVGVSNPICLTMGVTLDKFVEDKRKSRHIIRPAICIEKNGE